VKQLTLRDGTPAVMWPLLPTDARGLQESYQNLSAESRYGRFLAAVPTLSASMLRILVDAVDCVDHVALVLIALPDGAPEQGAGVGRLIRHRDQPTVADVAVTVADQWQRRGVATALLTELVQHRPPGVQQLLTLVGAGNRASLTMLSRLGPTEIAAAGLGVREVRVRLA
jgi:GNAT superfamily N-acetyltransferase